MVTYREMMLRYAHLRNLKRTIIIVPFFTPRLSSYWVHLVTPVSARLAQPLILGLHNEVIVRDSAARRDFPQFEPIDFETAVARVGSIPYQRPRNVVVRCVRRSGASGHVHGRAGRHADRSQGANCQRDAATGRIGLHALGGTQAGSTATRCGSCAASWTARLEALACGGAAAARPICG